LKGSSFRALAKDGSLCNPAYNPPFGGTHQHCQLLQLRMKEKKGKEAMLVAEWL
jgi:hypothetical protein